MKLHTIQTANHSLVVCDRVLERWHCQWWCDLKIEKRAAGHRVLPAEAGVTGVIGVAGVSGVSGVVGLISSSCDTQLLDTDETEFRRCP